MSPEQSESSSSFSRSLRTRSQADSIWPQPFVEALAREVALAAVNGGGSLAAVTAVVSVFQVCSTWRTISHSEILWEALTRHVWDRTQARTQSWRDEYIRLHLTASNFRHNRATYTSIEYEVSSDSDSNGAGAACRCLALSPEYLAVDFFDGALRVFSLEGKECVCTMKPNHENRLGPLSRAVAGIVMYGNTVVFASFDGNVFVGNVLTGHFRCASLGNVVNDGTLVDFTGCGRFWVGLCAGSPGHAYHIWDAATEQLVLNDGDITDLEALRGWRLLTEQGGRIGRVGINSNGILLTATKMKLAAFDLETYGVSFSREQTAVVGQELIVESVEANNDRFLTASNNGAARIRRITDFEDVCSFSFDTAAGDNNGNNHGERKVLGTLNAWQAFLCIDGVVHAWDAHSGLRLHRLNEHMGQVFDLVADDGHVAGCAIDSGVHLWSFRP
ncbi:hypothetical protein SUGI_0451080 [Cryptomeria japonica]|uniref:transcriptional regulator STERILE APETALA n=1 Tax=Cryptomeria japonica TaxID=3369 RepID=UPI002408EE88|nr:transcriptional regulator STERILE APETALA [Cryptomeria japonica]GLJ23772.1 hypothetical protein SUGI_0451080 [Cryptomeria japonica]